VTCITSGDHFFQVAVLCLDDLVSCFSLKLKVTGPTQLLTRHCFHWNSPFFPALEQESKQALEAGTAFGLLTIEFWLYAMRHPSTKARFARRFSIVRERLAEQIARRHSKHGVESRWSPDELAPLVLALDAGVVHPAPR
jgi:hypothetical protein